MFNIYYTSSSLLHSDLSQGMQERDCETETLKIFRIAIEANKLALLWGEAQLCLPYATFTFNNSKVTYIVALL